MSRIRLNQEYRNKIANRMRVHLEQENTQEKEAYLKAREEMKPLQDITWKLAEQIVDDTTHLKMSIWQNIYKTSLKMLTLSQKIVDFILATWVR